MVLDGSTIDIAAMGEDNTLVFDWSTAGTEPWHSEFAAGAGSAFSAPSMIFNGNTLVEIAVQGPDNSLVDYSSIGGGAGTPSPSPARTPPSPRRR